MVTRGSCWWFGNSTLLGWGFIKAGALSYTNFGGVQLMEVYVLVKQVPDPEALVKVKSDTELEIENKYFTNFFDEIAIEAGLKLKEKFGGKVTVLTVDNRKVDALRRGISMGADEAFQITDPGMEGSDQFAIARILTA